MKSKSAMPKDARAARGANKNTPRRAAPPKRTTHRRSPEIIEAAAQVFAELGYHGATTQKIADVLRIRQASLYYYFPSKEVALELVCAQGVAGYFETAKAIAAGPGSAAERLAGLMRAHISPILDRGNFVRVFLTQRQFLPNASRRRVGRWSRGLEKIFETVIREGMRVGDFRKDIDPRLATLAILGMSNAVTNWYSKENASIERIGQNYTALVLHGLAPSTSPRGIRTLRRI
jgi:TetR/AcrR family transcriptional regulator, cholesterol catabolism regulator